MVSVRFGDRLRVQSPAEQLPGQPADTEKPTFESWVSPHGRVLIEFHPLQDDSGNQSEGGLEFSAGRMTSKADRSASEPFVASTGGNSWRVSECCRLASQNSRLAIHHLHTSRREANISVAPCLSRWRGLVQGLRRQTAVPALMICPGLRLVGCWFRITATRLLLVVHGWRDPLRREEMECSSLSMAP